MIAVERFKYASGGRKTGACRLLTNPKWHTGSCEGWRTFRGLCLQVKASLMQTARTFMYLAAFFAAHHAPSSPSLSHVL